MTWAKQPPQSVRDFKEWQKSSTDVENTITDFVEFVKDADDGKLLLDVESLARLEKLRDLYLKLDEKSKKERKRTELQMWKDWTKGVS